ncbi:Bacterial inner-membrane translocator [Erwinia pyrifoliae Ep1/96]|nr:Bacterial inner-membrane translocator [Erwinia pyrifoliae Ep1/96]
MCGAFADKSSMGLPENIWLSREPVQFGFVDRASLNRSTKAKLNISLHAEQRVGSLSIASQQMVEAAVAASLAQTSESLSPLFPCLVNMPAVLPVMIFLAVALIFHIALKHTRYGKYVYVIGGNVLSAKVSGIYGNQYLVIVCTVAGGCRVWRADYGYPDWCVNPWAYPEWFYLF